MTLTTHLPSWLARRNVPDWLPAVVVKAMRQSLRSGAFALLCLWTQLSLALLVVLQAVTSEYTAGRLHLWQWLDTFLILVAIVPLWPIAVEDEDTRSESLDLIRLTRLPARSVAYGRLIGTCTQAVLLSISMVPYHLLSYCLGSTDAAAEIEAFLWLLANMFVLAPWGIVVGAFGLGGRAAFAPLLLGALLVVFGGLTMVPKESAEGLWFPWIPMASVVWMVGFNLAVARYDVR